jgi:heterodisulfide reductase subunit C
MMHFNLSAGFILLFLTHALDDQVTATLFSDYYPTLNPFLFLRNFFGAMILLGILIAVFRRLFSKGLKQLTTTHDVLALILLAVILLSGFFLEAGKIVSEPIFDEMIEDYGDVDDPKDIQALQGYWAKYYGVVFSGPLPLNDNDLMETGETVHLENCAHCHSRPAAAFVSYPLSRMMKPVAVLSNRARADHIWWHIHFLSCFLILAYLPFSKFVHIFTSSISLMVRSVEDRLSLRPVNRMTRRALSLDACMSCGLCSMHCSVRPIHRMMGNPNILPSSKLASLKALVRKPMPDPSSLGWFHEGSFICTSCYRCTRICPAGIDLQDLWLSSREDLGSLGLSEPYHLVRNGVSFKGTESTGAAGSGSQITLKLESPEFSKKPGSFSACIQCGTCTNVCPVVANYQDAPQVMGFLDINPQQIVNSFRLGMTDLVLSSRMVWDCFMCFKCQENCPREIPIAEMIYDLRNRGYAGIRKTA